MKPIHVKSNIYIDSSKESNNKNPKLKIGDVVGISEYTNFWPKVTLQISPKRFL